MPLIINTNIPAASAAKTLSGTNAALQKCLDRLSSGKRIISPSDDAGGLAVSMKMEAAEHRTRVVEQNIGNAISFLQTQDGALKTVTSILDRMSELKMMHQDVTKSAEDKTNYQTEFKALQAQLGNLAAEKFNGVALFDAAGAGTNLGVVINEDATQTVNVTQAGLVGDDGLKVGGAGANDLTDDANTIDSAGITIANIRTAIQNVATMRAQNGAQSSQLGFSAEMLGINRINLQAAISRITDVDVAAESGELARQQIKTQAGIGMLAQANSAPQAALSLLR